MTKFSDFAFLQRMHSSKLDHPDSTTLFYADEDDLDQCLYYLRTLSNILKWSSDSMWAALAKTTISAEASHKYIRQISR